MKRQCFFIFFIISIIIGIACGGYEEPSLSETSIIPSENFIQGSLSSFFFNTSVEYNNGFGEYQQLFNENITEEWHEFFNNKIDKKNISELLFSTSENDINIAYNAIKDNQTLTKYKYLQPIDKTVLLEFLKYLANAKHAESYANRDYEKWEDIEQKKFIANEAFEKQLVNLLNKTSNLFIKQRYLFQLVRYQYFNKSNASIVFDKYKNEFTKNTLYYRTMSYAAGALKNKKQIAKANYYYSIVFENCDQLKAIAHYGFKPQDEIDWDSTLRYCHSNAEKETIWSMIGLLYGDTERAMNEIYKLNPKSKYLELIALRYIQYVEYTTQNSFLFLDKTKQNPTYIDSNINQSNSNLIYKIAREKKTTRPLFWNELGAYLSMHRSEFNLTSEFIANAKKDNSIKLIDKNLIRLLEFIFKLSTATKINSSDENYIFSELKWIKSNIDSNNILNQTSVTDSNSLYFQMPYNLSIIKISELYRSQNDLIKAECFNVNSGFYIEEKNIVAMKEFINKKTKTQFEELALSIYKYNLNNLNEQQAILYALNGDLKKSIDMISNSGLEGKELHGNPFNNNIKDCHDCDHENYKGKPYTIKTLLEKMVIIDEKIKSKTDVFTNAILLGNAYYNISYYGNARIFTETEIIGSNYCEYAISKGFRPALLSMKNCTPLYELALKNATNDEQKAKCHYLLAKCERNEWYNKEYFLKYKTGYDYDYEERKTDFIAWENFKILKQQFMNTKYAQEVIKECGYFITYYNKK